VQENPPDPFAQLADWAAKTERRVRGRRRWRWVAVAAGAVALVVVVGLALRASAPGGVTVTGTPSAAPADPFAGTPAATYPTGADGITLPKAAAVTGFSAAQVGADLAQVRAAMIAARLDRRMLTGHDPAPFVAMFAPNQRAALTKDFAGTGFATFATWIDPAVRLDPSAEPRVSGHIGYTSVVVDNLRTLRVTTNFVWVYAFDRADRPLAVAHDELRWDFPSTTDLRAGDHGMWLADRKSYTALVDCAASARGLLAPTRAGGGHPDPAPTEDENALLRADHTLDIRDDC
jgi:hypothetical protein